MERPEVVVRMDEGRLPDFGRSIPKKFELCLSCIARDLLISAFCHYYGVIVLGTVKVRRALVCSQSHCDLFLLKLLQV